MHTPGTHVDPASFFRSRILIVRMIFVLSPLEYRRVQTGASLPLAKLFRSTEIHKKKKNTNIDSISLQL